MKKKIESIISESINHALSYVNNAEDNAPKVLTREILQHLLDSPQTQRQVEKYRQTGDKKYKEMLPGVLFNALAKKGARRSKDNCISWTFCGLDFDGEAKGRADELFEHMKEAIEKQLDRPWKELVAMAYRTPSYGLRVVVKRSPGLTISEEFRKWDKIAGIECDKVCCDPARVFFLTGKEDLLYLNSEMLFEQQDYDPQDYPFGRDTTEQRLQEGMTQPVNPLTAFQLPDEWKQIPPEDIVMQLENIVGGGPALKGNRNSQVFETAKLMRYVMGDDVEALAQVIPCYDGMDPKEHKQAISNALKYNERLSYIPVNLRRAICMALAQHSQDHYVQPMPLPLPTELPPCMDCFLQSTPHNAREAVAMAVFSPLRLFLHCTSFKYIDNLCYEPCFMNLLVGEQASGKHAVRLPINAILKPIQNADNEARLKERQWREKCTTLGANAKKPETPHEAIRIVSGNTTTAALLKRLADAQNNSIYSYAEEIEKMLALSGFSEMIRTSFDGETYGHERVGAGSVCDVVTMRWSFNVSTTPQTARKFMRKEVLNGTLTRLAVSTIQNPADDWGEEMPRYGSYGEDYCADIQPFIERLREAKGVIEIPQALQWVEQLKKQLIDQLRQMDARYMKPFLFRSLLMGFWRACMLYIMQGEWTRQIEEFATWSVQYDLASKIQLFGDLIEQETEVQMPDNTKRNTNLLRLLPNEFTREQARMMRQDAGKTTGSVPLKNMLAQWTHRGFITYDKQRELYVKIIPSAA